MAYSKQDSYQNNIECQVLSQPEASDLQCYRKGKRQTNTEMPFLHCIVLYWTSMYCIMDKIPEQSLQSSCTQIQNCNALDTFPLGK